MSLTYSNKFSVATCVYMVTMATITWDVTSGHPQCLDFLPPFELKDVSNIFCDGYASFGCCSKQRNIALQNEYLEISKKLEARQLWHCKDYLKDLLCQECSPYAAHLFDSETTLVKRPLAGMCSDYCVDFYQNCGEVVSYMTDDITVLTSMAHVGAFCGNNALPDVQYCYPDILTNSALNQDLDRSTVTEEGCLCLEPFASNLQNPLIFRSPDDQSGSIFVGTQIGVIYTYHIDGSREDGPFLNLSDVVLTTVYAGDERGLLGLAFHLNYKTNRKFYLFFSVRSSTGSRQKIRISEFMTEPDDPYKADRMSERVILEVSQPYANHNGGELLFGVDGYLYAFLGDGGAGGDPRNHGQNRSSLLGSVLRLDVDHYDSTTPYSIPPDNPYVGDKAYRPEIFAYGIRNIWRCDVDEGDPITGYGRGRIICGDVGQSEYEEIDVIKKGLNYGWNAREGFECFRKEKCGKIGVEELPIHAYNHSVGNSVTGGHVYRGCLNPNLQGHYIYGDYGRGRLFRLKETYKGSGRWEDKEIKLCGDDICFNGLTNKYERNILSFGEDFNGEIYVLTTSWPSSTSSTGKIYKIVDPRRRGDESLCRSNSWDTTPGTSTSSTTQSTTTATTTTEVPTTTTTPTTSTTASTTIIQSGGDCADIAFILDASGSVGIRQFRNDLLPFVLHHVSSLSLGPQAFQVGVVTFGNKATINIPLNKSHEFGELESMILNIRYKDENTNTSGALRETREGLFSGKYGARPGVKKIGVLLTDGRSTYDKHKTIPEAVSIHKANIEMYVISFGNRFRLDQYELDQISSKPLSQHLLHQDILDPNNVKLFPWTSATSKYTCTFNPGTDVPTTSTLAPTTSTTESSTIKTSEAALDITTESTMDSSTTGISKELWSCNFDSDPPWGPWCGMVQSLKDQFNWSVTNRETPSHPTGPDKAQDGNYFIYIETSNPRRPQDTAIVYIDPSLTFAGDLCLTFYVHMYGHHIWEIQVIVEHESGNSTVAWTEMGQKGNFWIPVELHLTNILQKDKIAFVGIRGNEYSGDIALDNIHLFQGSCAQLG